MKKYSLIRTAAVLFFYVFDLHSSIIYVANSATNSVDVIESSTNMVVDTIMTTANTSDVAVNSDNSFIYVTLASNAVDVINAATNMVIATVPVGNTPIYGIAVTSDNAHVYLSNNLSDDVSVIQTSDNTVIATVAVGTFPYGLTITPTEVYVANAGTSNVSVISRATNMVTNTVVLPAMSAPTGVAYIPGTAEVYVADRGIDMVSIINTATHMVTNTIAVGTLPGSLAVSENSSGTEVYVTNNMSDDISVINTATQTVTFTIPLVGGSGPRGITATSDGQFVYVSNFSNSTVSVIETSSHSIIATIMGFSSPFGIATSSNASGLIAPTNLRGEQTTDNFGLIYELFDALTWEASTSASVTGYTIYSNERLIGTVSSSEAVDGVLSFQAHNINPRAARTYFVAAVNSSEESDFTTITIP